MITKKVYLVVCLNSLLSDHLYFVFFHFMSSWFFKIFMWVALLNFFCFCILNKKLHYLILHYLPNRLHSASKFQLRVYKSVFVVFTISLSTMVSLYDDHFEVCIYCKGKTFHIVLLKIQFDSQIMFSGCQNFSVAMLKLMIENVYIETCETGLKHFSLDPTLVMYVLWFLAREKPFLVDGNFFSEVDSRRNSLGSNEKKMLNSLPLLLKNITGSVFNSNFTNHAENVFIWLSFHNVGFQLCLGNQFTV